MTTWKHIMVIINKQENMWIVLKSESVCKCFLTILCNCLKTSECFKNCAYHCHFQMMFAVSNLRDTFFFCPLTYFALLLWVSFIDNFFLMKDSGKHSVCDPCFCIIWETMLIEIPLLCRNFLLYLVNCFLHTYFAYLYSVTVYYWKIKI